MKAILVVDDWMNVSDCVFMLPISFGMQTPFALPNDTPKRWVVVSVSRWSCVSFGSTLPFWDKQGNFLQLGPASYMLVAADRE
jgi:hypothetical protein